MNILLLQLKRIGDLVLTTPAFAALREKFPDANLTLVVSPNTAALAPAIPHIDHVLVAKGLSPFVHVARSRFDCCIDFTRNDRSAIFTLLSGAKMRIAARRGRARPTRRPLFYNAPAECFLRFQHTSEANLALLAPLEIHDTSHPLQLKIPPQTIENAARVRTEHHIADPFVIFHPGSARAEKFWEAERWAEVIDYARSRHNFCCVLTGSATQLELGHLHQIKAHTGADIIDLAGKIDILTLAALIGQARLVVTVDSAPVHLAAAMRTPQVALFGPTNPFHWRPRESPALILQGASQLPVSEFSPAERPARMNQISTRAVIDAMESLLSAATLPTSG